MLIEWPRSANAQFIVSTEHDTVRIAFVPQARYMNRRVREVTDESAQSYLLKGYGCVKYDGLVATAIPEDVEPTDEMWEEAIVTLLNAAPENVREEFITKVTGENPVTDADESEGEDEVGSKNQQVGSKNTTPPKTRRRRTR